ncbi:MAG: hypothetical protein KF819_20525 [Labilithrix sp.]|nr:hypothetical protein [Labilithrix sp.]
MGKLIERDDELDALTKELAKHPIVSVTGPPGVGKSALAAAIAGAVLCPLAGASTRDAVCEAVARALGLPSAAPERIARAAASRGKIALILDDADLARAALPRLVATWSREAPRARWIVTSRSRLALPVARRFDVAPLDLPASDDADAIAKAPAVRLFVHAARNVRPTYRLTATTAPLVRDIVRALGGLPLAIELCASRTVVLDEREILDLLARRLDVLDTGAGAARGRTLRGAFELSWDQLDASDARVLAACSSFRGSFDLGAAAAVCRTRADDRDRDRLRLRIAASLERLEEASLVRAFEPETLPEIRRYELTPTLRAFAAEKLRPDEAAELARKHAAHHAARAPRGLSLADRSSLEALALDREDLESAAQRCIDDRDAEAAARVMLVLAPLVLARGPLGPFLARLDALLALRARKRIVKATRAELLLARALARLFHGKRDEALADLKAAQRIAREARVWVLATSKIGLILGLGAGARGARDARRHFDAALRRLGPSSREPALRGIVHKDRANMLSELGASDEAMVELARARDLFRAAGDVREEGFVLMLLGARLLDVGRVADARRDCAAALELLREAGDRRSEGWTRVLLALIDAEDGDLAAARARFEAVLASFRAIGDVHTEGIVLGYLGNVALEQGALADAESAYRDARLRLAEVGDRGMEAMCTAGAGVVEALCGRAATAKEAFARAKKLVAADGRGARKEAVAILASVVSASPPGARSEGSEEVRFAWRVVERARARASAEKRRGLVVAADGSWLTTSEGKVVKIARAGAVRRVVQRLATDRVRFPGRPVAFGALVRAGWPDEEILPSAAKNRLHVTIARLRRGGLADVLILDDDGYLLDARVPARIAEAGEGPD